MAWFPSSSPTKYIQKVLKFQFVHHTDVANDTKGYKGKISVIIWVGEKKKQSFIARSTVNTDAKFAQFSEIQTPRSGIL